MYRFQIIKICVSVGTTCVISSGCLVCGHLEVHLKGNSQGLYAKNRDDGRDPCCSQAAKLSSFGTQIFMVGTLV